MAQHSQKQLLMRFLHPIALALAGPLVSGTLLAQEMSARRILTDAEIAFPSSTAPVLFGPESAASRFAGEPEDSRWSSAMEARILELIDAERSRGLVVRRTDVECRTSTCAVLLVHAASTGSPDTVDDLGPALRETLGFAGLSSAKREIPLLYEEEVEPGQRMTLTKFISGYVEIVLVGGIGTGLQVSEGSLSP